MLLLNLVLIVLILKFFLSKRNVSIFKNKIDPKKFKIQSDNGSRNTFRGKVSELQEIRSNEDQDSQECQDELLHLLLLLFALLYPRQHCDGSSFMSSLQSFDHF